MRFSLPLLTLCAEALAEVGRFSHPADAVLSRFFRAQRNAGRSDRALIADTIYAALRRWHLVQAVAPGAGMRRLVMLVWHLQLGASLDDLTDCLKGEDGRWLIEAAERANAPQEFAVECDLPDWVLAALRLRLADDAVLELARALQQPAPLDLRVNILKAERDSVLARLRADGILAEAMRYAPAGIRVKGNPPLNRHPLFLDGSIEVQDEGSQLVALLLEPRRGEMVVDYCAGAGGKTLALGAMMRSTGRLYAFDVSEHRLERIRPRLARSGLQNVHVQRIGEHADPKVGRLAGKIHRVLVDAPCSGLGTLRRNPDLKMRQSAAGVQELVRKQASILARSAQLPMSGGRLVYATCSLLPEENEQVVRQFLDAHPGYRLLPVQGILDRQKIPLVVSGEFLELGPVAHATDGFFAAVMERVGPGVR